MRSKKVPPRWADAFLRWYCRPSLLEEIQGDLHEAFYKRCDEFGLHRAKLLFVMEVIRSLSFDTIDNPFRSYTLSAAMLANYLKSGWRNFVKYKGYSLINFLGLSIGFSAALLLFLIIRFERSFDTFHNEPANIYRLGNSFGADSYDDVVVTPQASLMKSEYPEIVAATRFYEHEDFIEYNGMFVRTPYVLVDPDFATMFNFKVISGDLSKALSSPNQIVLTKSTAERLFGKQDPIGKVIHLVEAKVSITVAAITEDVPGNSSLKFEALVPWSNAPSWLNEDQVGNWYNTFMRAYIKTAADVSRDELEKRLIRFKDTHFLEERRASWRVILLPLLQEHERQTKNEDMILILGIIAGAILTVSTVNFANLSVAQTLKRTREVGLRRVLGSLRSHVLIQFMMESMIACVVSLAVGIAIAWLLLPAVNSYYDLDVRIDLQDSHWLLLFLVSICSIPLLFASIGPALAIAHLKPATAMKGLLKGHSSGEYLRRSLIVVQFAVSVVLLVGAMVVWQQIRFMKTHDLKMDYNYVVAMSVWPESFKDPKRAEQLFVTLRNELTDATAIESVSLTSNVPGDYSASYNGFRSIDSTETKSVSLRQISVDHNFFNTFGMKIVQGRNFSQELQDDKQAVIINEAAMNALGWTDIADKQLMGGGEYTPYKVVGVVRDYHYQSLKRSIEPLIHYYAPNAVQRLAVRLNPDRISEGLELLKKKWEMTDPYEPFQYKFVDESFDHLYKEQERLSSTSTLFSGIAVVLASLGLLSITAYSIRLRRREVSIRKVLGASVSSIIFNLSRGYTSLVIVGFIIGCAIAYYLAEGFLSGFAYRIDLSPMVFVLVGVLVLTFALSIVGWLSGKAALDNPVDALKEE